MAGVTDGFDANFHQRPSACVVLRRNSVRTQQGPDKGSAPSWVTGAAPYSKAAMLMLRYVMPSCRPTYHWY